MTHSPAFLSVVDSTKIENAIAVAGTLFPLISYFEYLSAQRNNIQLRCIRQIDPTPIGNSKVVSCVHRLARRIGGRFPAYGSSRPKTLECLKPIRIRKVFVFWQSSP